MPYKNPTLSPIVKTHVPHSLSLFFTPPVCLNFQCCHLQNVSLVNTVLASITAKVFKEFADAIEAGATPKSVAQKALKDSWKVRLIVHYTAYLLFACASGH